MNFEDLDQSVLSARSIQTQKDQIHIYCNNLRQYLDLSTKDIFEIANDLFSQIKIP